LTATFTRPASPATSSPWSERLNDDCLGAELAIAEAHRPSVRAGGGPEARDSARATSRAVLLIIGVLYEGRSMKTARAKARALPSPPRA